MQGKIVNGYMLRRKLGEGGMAEVWYAENEIGLVAAVKVLNADLSHNEQIVERFHNEALMMVKLNHPNIRRVFGYGYLGDRHCIIMEYLEGEDLEALIKRGRRFTEEELRRWWNQSVDALNYTHAMGIVHRDIKPSNFFLDKSGDIKLLDFGIAKDTGAVSMTRTGTRMGTLMYMSPEQVRNSKDIDNRTDIYSLALTFVQLFAGKHPCADDTTDEFDIQLSIVTKPVNLSGVPAEWQDFLAPYLEKEPGKRPALRRFEPTPVVSAPVEPDNTSTNTVQSEIPPFEDYSKSSFSEKETLSPVPNDKPKSKKGLWIGLGIAAVVTATIVVLLAWPKQEQFEGPYAGYKKTKNGLYYRFFKQNKNTEQPQVGDLIDMRIFSAVNDTNIIIASSDNTTLLEASMFAGDFYEGLAMMHKGDSASFIVNIDSTFIKWFHQPSLPEEFKSTDVMRFEVRLDDFYPESEYATRYGAKVKKDTEARIEKMKSDYPEETAMAAQQLTDYLVKNKIEVQPTASGLYYVKTQDGNGEKPEVGQMVQVHYNGKLLDGTLFDSSIERGEPISVTIGVGQVIPGWDEGIMMMSKGEKGILFIPYYLAYGDRQAGDWITPFSNLMFDVELIDFYNP